MAGTAPSRRTVSQRIHFILVRSATLFVIGAAAIASCQSSKDDAEDSPIVGFIEQETCLDWGGRWVTGHGMCELGNAVGERSPESSLPGEGASR